jgi:hypothetical protein
MREIMSKSREIIRRVYILEWRLRDKSGGIGQREFKNRTDLNEQIKWLHADLFVKVTYNPPHYNLNVGDFWCCMDTNFADGRVELKPL